MSRIRSSILAALAAAGVTTGCLYLLNQPGNREAGALRLEIADLRSRAVEHDRTRAVAAAVSSVSAPAPAPAVPVAVAAPASMAAPAPMPIYRDEGRATARAALQTFAWACDRGDQATVQAMITFDDVARVKATQMFAAIPPGARSAWRTVDDMAAALLTQNGMAAPFPAADVLEHVQIEEVSADRMRIRLSGRRNDTEFQRTSTGWSYVITEPMVDRYIEQQQAAAAGR
jgi:hypothetical protein